MRISKQISIHFWKACLPSHTSMYLVLDTLTLFEIAFCSLDPPCFVFCFLFCFGFLFFPAPSESKSFVFRSLKKNCLKEATWTSSKGCCLSRAYFVCSCLCHLLWCRRLHGVNFLPLQIFWRLLKCWCLLESFRLTDVIKGFSYYVLTKDVEPSKPHYLLH